MIQPCRGTRTIFSCFIDNGREAKELRKNWLAFWMISAAGAAAVILAAALARFSETLCCIAAAAGIMAWTVFLARFHCVEYIVNSKEVIVRSGLLIKSARIIPKDGILWKSSVKIGGASLFTALHTAAGTVILFTDFP